MDEKAEHLSYWSSSIKPPHFPTLQKDVSASICVVGAGIAGLTTAYLLASKGKSVIVIDKGKVASGDTSKTTAHLTYVLDERYYELESQFPNDVKKIVESHIKAIDEIEKIVKREKIDCDFKRVDGYLFLSDQDHPDLLRKEFSALKRIGLKNVEFLEEGPIPSLGPCIRFPGQAEMHPLKYLTGLSKAIIKKGGRIFVDSKAKTFQTSGMPIRVITDEGRLIESDYLVVATHTPIDDLVVMHTKQAAYRTYVIAGWVPRGAVPEALYWDTGDPYYYIRTYRDPFNQLEDLLIIGGEDHKTGENPKIDPFGKLEIWAQEKFPLFEKVSYYWSGQVIEPIDSIAFIGKNPLDSPNVYIATSESGNGTTYGTISGMVISELIIKNKSLLEEIYSPRRKPYSNLKQYLKDNLKVVFHYIKSIFPVQSATSEKLKILPNECGTIFQDGLKKYAYYKDQKGNIHKFAARCTHLGCLISWNDNEKTWDCPCHGSRYSCLGEVINGPAVKNLEEIQ